MPARGPARRSPEHHDCEVTGPLVGSGPAGLSVRFIRRTTETRTTRASDSSPLNRPPLTRTRLPQDSCRRSMHDDGMDQVDPWNVQCAVSSLPVEA